LEGYEYSQAGAYFVTICTQDQQCLFGEIENGNMRLNEAGTMIQTVWDEIPFHYPGVDIDEFVIMPNHIHGIVNLVGAGPRACPDSVYPGDVVQVETSRQRFDNMKHRPRLRQYHPGPI
jgi:putative transposase